MDSSLHQVSLSGKSSNCSSPGSLSRQNSETGASFSSFIMSRSPSKSALNVSSRADEMTRYTSFDSFACKYSVSECNYPAMSPQHVTFMRIMKQRLERATGKKFTKRSPVMHRGYFARMEGQHMAIEEFLKATDASGDVRQLLYLGCGFDTSPIATYAHFQSSSSTLTNKKIRVFEVDFPDIIHQKYEIYSTEQRIVTALATGEQSLDDEIRDVSQLPRGASSRLVAETIAEESEDDLQADESPRQGGRRSYQDDKDNNVYPTHHNSIANNIVSLSALAEGKDEDNNDDENFAFGFADKKANVGWDEKSPFSRGSQHSSSEKSAGSNNSSSGYFHSHHRLGALTLISQDLRDSESLLLSLTAAGFDSSRPTLIVSECVLVYLTAAETQDLISSLGTYMARSTTAWISYDMISPHDAYGQMMTKNLSKAGFVLPGFVDFPTLASHEDKYLNNQAHWPIAKSVDMLQFYNRVLPTAIIERIQQLELLDEMEEWNMIMSHYCITVAINRPALSKVVDALTCLRPVTKPSPARIFSR